MLRHETCPPFPGGENHDIFNKSTNRSYLVLSFALCLPGNQLHPGIISRTPSSHIDSLHAPVASSGSSSLLGRSSSSLPGPLVASNLSRSGSATQIPRITDPPLGSPSSQQIPGFMRTHVRLIRHQSDFHIGPKGDPILPSKMLLYSRFESLIRNSHEPQHPGRSSNAAVKGRPIPPDMDMLGRRRPPAKGDRATGCVPQVII
ncbi:hypothetical protein F4861DRAFT_460933 [Xylaria intraflava]|nr:hypothetical protein F4861DRAFT_460933 [Xylaria intraflava]